jgi:hypothetical protein
VTAIWYSDADDRIVIEGALQTYAPRTLMAVVTDAGISVRLKVRTTNEFGPFAFDDLTDAAGDRFTSTDAALAYLNGVFARKPAIGEIFGIATVCEADILRGQPVVVSRATGRLLSSWVLPKPTPQRASRCVRPVAPSRWTIGPWSSARRRSRPACRTSSALPAALRPIPTAPPPP